MRRGLAFIIPGGLDDTDHLALIGAAWRRLNRHQQQAKLALWSAHRNATLCSTLPELPQRDCFSEEDAYFEALYFWQYQIGLRLTAIRQDSLHQSLALVRQGRHADADDGQTGSPDLLEATLLAWERKRNTH